MKNKIFLLVWVMLSSCSPIGSLYNDFGSLKQRQQAESPGAPIRIYFDRNGFLYPDFHIDSTLFKRYGSVLNTVYQNNSVLFLNVCKAEGMLYQSSKTTRENIEILRQHQDQKYSNAIDKASAGKTLVFLIHGYNNTAEKAAKSFNSLRAAVSKLKPQSRFQFVEVYWDGLHNGGKIGNTAKIWDNAQYSAARAGLGLRRILNSISSKHSFVITHSQGAAVITEALFNVRRFSNRFYDKDSLGIAIMRMRNSPLYNSPSSRFTVGMLAPAIPGKNVFEHYYMRTVEGKNMYQPSEPYNFINGFNKYDFAVTKLLFSSYAGSTTLACREKEHIKVQEFFKGDLSLYDRVVFSKSHGHRQTSHGVKDYIANENFPIFIEKILAQGQ